MLIIIWEWLLQIQLSLESGAKILDATARGFGAGAGNTQLEVLVAVLERMGFVTGINLYKMLDAAEIAEENIMKSVPFIKSESIISGMAGVFSGFARHVSRISNEYKVDSRDVYFELGRRKIIGGQEDMIIEVVMDLIKNRQS